MRVYVYQRGQGLVVAQSKNLLKQSNSPPSAPGPPKGAISFSPVFLALRSEIQNVAVFFQRCLVLALPEKRFIL